MCEHSVGPGKTCDFRTGKIILQQEISAAQVAKLLTEGKTDLLEGFVSSRTNRKFKAYLVRQSNGKIGFEFEVRAPKAGAKSATKSAGAAKKTATKATAKKAAKKTTAKKAAAKKSATKKAASV